MTHSPKWYEWFVQTDECLATHFRPGECVGSDGPAILASIGIATVAITLIAYWRRKQ